MNKSKRIKKAVTETGDKGKERVVNSKVLTISAIVFVVILIGALLFDQLYESPLLTIDGKKYHMQDLSYYFYTVEYQYDSLDQMFGGTGAYWNMSADDSGTVSIRDVAKEEAINNSIYNELLYNEAVSEGYALTEEEKNTADTNAENMMEGALSEEIISKSKFTKEYLTEVLGKTALVARFRKDKVDALDIDDEEIKAGVSYEEYRQYDVEYLFTSKKTTGEDGNSVDKTEDQKTTDSNTLKSYYEKAKTAEDWSKLLAEDEKAVTYQTSDFIKSDTTFDDEFEAKIMAMENGEISEVYETDSGYYVVRMIDNNSSESYDNAVKDAITAAENEGFTNIYQDILKKHEYKVNQTVLRSLTMGSITLPR